MGIALAAFCRRRSSAATSFHRHARHEHVRDPVHLYAAGHRPSRRGDRELPRLDARCVRFLSRHLRADGDRQGVRASRQGDRAVADDHARLPAGRCVHLRAHGRPLRPQDSADDRPRVLFDRRGGDGTRALVRGVSRASRALRDRNGRRMGRRRVARDGEGAGSPARRALRIPAGGLRGRQPARRPVFLLRVPALGLASDVLHRRNPGAARALRALVRQGIRGLGADAASRLGRVRPRPGVAPAALSLPVRADDDDELRLAWHAGHVSDVPQARLEFHARSGSR